MALIGNYTYRSAFLQGNYAYKAKILQSGEIYNTKKRKIRKFIEYNYVKFLRGEQFVIMITDLNVKEKYCYYLKESYDEIFQGWMKILENKVPDILSKLDNNILREQSYKFMDKIVDLLEKDISLDFNSPEYQPLKQHLVDISIFYAQKGITPELTAGYIISFKDAMVVLFNKIFSGDAKWMYACLVLNKDLLDPMALYTYKVFVHAREDIIRQQAMDIAELSTPVIQLWDGVLVLPLIGTIDSARAKQIMENLLNEIVKTKSSQVVMDITGVPVVDSGVADRLMRTVEAARLLGAECILTGISPVIAQTLVMVGVNMGGIQTRGTLRTGLELALSNLNLQVVTKVR